MSENKNKKKTKKNGMNIYKVADAAGNLFRKTLPAAVPVIVAALIKTKNRNGRHKS